MTIQEISGEEINNFISSNYEAPVMDALISMFGIDDFITKVKRDMAKAESKRISESNSDFFPAL